MNGCISGASGCWTRGGNDERRTHTIIFIAENAVRILLVNYEYPPLGGGAGQATASLAREFAAAGHAALVLTSRFRGQPAREEIGGVTILRVPVVRRREDRCTPPEMLTFLISASVAALGEVRAWRPGVTLAFFGIPSGPVGLLLSLMSGVPYVVSLRGGDVPGFQPYDLARMHRLLGPAIRLLWKRAAGVVANSAGLRTLARRFAPDIEIATIPNGVDTATFRPREGGAPPHGPVRLLFVGRVVFQKGIDVLLAALAQIPRDHDWQLEIIGDGDRRAALEAEVQRLGLAARITFAGWCHRAEIAERYRSAAVFVFPSRDEGMPNVVLEAMASGLPIVATAIAGNEELVLDGENGFLVPPDDALALTTALTRIVADTAMRERMGRASRERTEREYAWPKIARHHLQWLSQRVRKA
jgi:glycosyltransferase involved in cell wall biosynthesis